MIGGGGGESAPYFMIYSHPNLLRYSALNYTNLKMTVAFFYALDTDIFVGHSRPVSSACQCGTRTGDQAQLAAVWAHPKDDSEIRYLFIK